MYVPFGRDEKYAHRTCLLTFNSSREVNRLLNIDTPTDFADG